MRDLGRHGYVENEWSQDHICLMGWQGAPFCLLDWSQVRRALDSKSLGALAAIGTQGVGNFCDRGKPLEAQRELRVRRALRDQLSRMGAGTNANNDAVQGASGTMETVCGNGSGGGPGNAGTKKIPSCITLY